MAGGCAEVALRNPTALQKKTPRLFVSAKVNPVLHLGPRIMLRGKHLALFGEAPVDMRCYMVPQQCSSVG